VEALRRYVMAAGKLHADDTPVPVPAPGNGKTKTGRSWTVEKGQECAENRSNRASLDVVCAGAFFP
jgi:transposase